MKALSETLDDGLERSKSPRIASLYSEQRIVNAPNKSKSYYHPNDINIELSNEFLVKLRKSAYHGWIDEDVVNHTAKVLEMIDLIYIPGVDSHHLGMTVIPPTLDR
ncbi:hypothetical protein Tco_0349762 [Tanacetum coccineum]